MKAIIAQARWNLAAHLRNGFAAWCAGDVAGMTIARDGARRCHDVIRIAETFPQIP